VLSILPTSVSKIKEIYLSEKERKREREREREREKYKFLFYENYDYYNF